jgi:histidine ammonia-lyase
MAMAAIPVHHRSRTTTTRGFAVGTNAPFVMERVRAQIDNSFAILSMELLHAAQAADLRLKEHPERKLASATKSFHDAFRQKVPFLDRDRSMTPDIAAGSDFLKDYALTN